MIKFTLYNYKKHLQMNFIIKNDLNILIYINIFKYTLLMK